MKISLYSKLARRHVVVARRIIANTGAPDNANGIRKFRRDIFCLQHAELSALKTINDMYSMSTCRDLLFHTRESHFSIEDIKAYLNELGLIFIGFEGIAAAKQNYKRMFPDDPGMINLDNWSVFESRYPDTFISMYDINAQKL